MTDSRANPAPLGLMGFGMTTVLLSFHNAGFFETDDLIIAMAIFYGGLAQVIAGVLEYRKGNTFGMTAFVSYGMFWLTLVYILLAGDSEALTVGHDTTFMGWYLFMWGLFTAYMFVGTLYKNRALQVVFGTLALTFWLLAVGDWFTAPTITNIAGYLGVFCGSSAIYLAAAEVLNDSAGRTLLPVGTVTPKGQATADDMPPIEPTVEHPREAELMSGRH
jgi:succinate-acetate transporter protein